MVNKDEPRHFTEKQAEKLIRGIPTTESILNGVKRISVFKGIDAIQYLMNKKHLMANDAKTVITLLLDNHYIVRVRPVDDQYVLDISYEFNINHKYIWLKEESKKWLILASFFALLAVLIIAMFPIWPRKIKIGTGYLFYVLIGIIVALLVITVIRAILYAAVWLCTRQSFWLFPNLYAECGILESFMPLYSWGLEKEAVNASAQKAGQEMLNNK